MGRRWTHFEQSLKRITLQHLERRFARPVRLPEDLLARPVRRILIVRQHDQIGDFLLATPVLGAVRARWPNAHVGLVVRGYFEGVARHHPHVDEVIVYHEALRRWTPAGVVRLVRALRRGWDLTIVLNTVSHSLTSDAIARASGAPFVLGSAHRVFPGCTRNFLYDLLAPFAEGLWHQSERNLDIVRYVGADTHDLRETMRVLPAESEDARERLRILGLRGAGGPIVGIHPGAGKMANRWPVEHFASLADQLRREVDARIVLFWGPREADLASAFLERTAGGSIRVGPGPVRELASAFSVCNLLVVNDTGVMHVGAACGVPVVAVFGPTDPKQWKPAGEHVVAVHAPSGNTSDVPVQEVFLHARQLLHQATAKGAEE